MWLRGRYTIKSGPSGLTSVKPTQKLVSSTQRETLRSEDLFAKHILRQVRNVFNRHSPSGMLADVHFA
jgi:hypothetical protein